LNTDNEFTVDALASNAFDEVPQQDIGYFGDNHDWDASNNCLLTAQGQTSNHALFRILSSAFINQLPTMCPSQQHYTGTSMHKAYVSSPVTSQDLAGPSTRWADSHLKLIDPFALPNDQDLGDLINSFFTSAYLVFPYVEKIPLPYEGIQSNRTFIWQASKSGRALLNVICAHSALILRSSDAELFYRRTLLLLDELTIRGSSLELGM
jgi:hypothetical protein